MTQANRTATHMFREAGEAPAAVARALAANAGAVARIAARLKAHPPRAVVTAARGSSDHAATYAKYLIETRLGILTSSAALSVSSVYTARTDLKDTLFLAISQSGRSPDLLAALEAAKEAGAVTLALVNDAGSPLAARADAVLPLHAGPELSVAATKSFIAANAAIAHLVSDWSGDAALRDAMGGLPHLLEQAWRLDWSAAVPRLARVNDLYVIGRGVGFGVAGEAALKLKETCAMHAEAFSAAEVQHGPMTLVKPGFPVLVLSQDDETRAGIEQLVANLAAGGAEVMLAGFAHPGALALPSLAAHPALEPILFAESFYRLAEALSRARGLDPDAPPHLSKITETV